MEQDYPKEYYEFIAHFNRGEFYECHDLLEDIWLMDRENKFLQGLLQMSVGIYHFENGNIKGARLLLESALRYLDRYVPKYWQLNIEVIVHYIETCLRALPEADSWPVERIGEISFPYLNITLHSSS